MGTIVPRPQKDGTTRYRAQVRIMRAGKIIHNESRTFSKQPLAKAWLAKREAELEKPGAIEAQRHAGISLGSLLSRYADEVSTGFGRSKQAHLAQLMGMPLASEPALGITSARLMQHIRWRAENGAGPATISNDLVWLRIALRYARDAWGWPIDLEQLETAARTARASRQIGKPKRRTRRPTPDELERLDAYFASRQPREKSSPPMRLIMWLAIYSCRRQDELTRLRWADLDRESLTYLVRDLKHPDGSAGNDKLALMPARGWEVVEALPQIDDRLLPYKADTISAAFTRACKVLGIEDLRFHDLRHEACSRLAEDGATIPEIQQVTLHESWSSLQVYVNMKVRRQRRVDFTPMPSSPSRPRPLACRGTEPAR